MNTTQLECFLAVAEFLNFARAAQHLHITQPAVTHQIATLEDDLGVKLFERSTRSVRLTDAGGLFMEDARNILQISLSARSRLSTLDSQGPRFFTIGLHGVPELSMLPPILSQLCREFPMVHPRLRVVPFRSLENLLQENALDVMLGFSMEPGEQAPGIYRELCPVPIACLCRDDHPLSQKKQLTLQELHQGSMVLCEPRANPSIARIQGQLVGFRPHTELYIADNPMCAMTLVQAGLGFSILPDLKPLRLPGLCYIPVTDADVLSYGLYYRSLGKDSILKYFIDTARSSLAQWYQG